MAISDILDQRIVDFSISARNKEEVLQHMSDLLLRHNYISDKQQFIHDIYLREQEGLTGIGQSVAIPHGKSKAVLTPTIAIGKTEELIEWESIDGNPVNIIFLFVVPDNDDYTKNHMRILSELATKLGRDQVIEGLQLVKSFEGLVELFA